MFRIIILSLLGAFCVTSLVFAKNRDYTKAIIHHTGNDKNSTVEQIDIYHKSKGWDGCGYHYLIREDGQVYVGRDYKKQGAHAKGRNKYTGIALTGYDKFTKEQISSLIALLKKLQVKEVQRHHNQCPGEGLDVEYIQEVIR